MDEENLAALEHDYQSLLDQVRELGFVAPGSVIERYTLCATPTCRCHGDPPSPHGPYFQYTRKLAGKTLTRRLNGEQAALYREWITNRRSLDELLGQMDQTSRHATDLILARASQDPRPTRSQP
jgi:hypothetical protein